MLCRHYKINERITFSSVGGVIMEVKKLHDCPGLFFRAFSTLYFSKERFEVTEKRGFRLLKRKSCSGCEKCYGLIDYIEELFVSVRPDYLLYDGKEIDSFKEYTTRFEDDGEIVIFTPIKKELIYD